GEEWKGGFITYVEPSVTMRRFRGIDPSFGVRREDVEVGARIGLSHRKLSFLGFMPRFEYAYSRQFSTIVFQRREIHSANIVLTLEFGGDRPTLLLLDSLSTMLRIVPLPRFAAEDPA